jgi:hypothetical protein
MKHYRTPEADRVRQKRKRDAIRAAGGEAYEKLLAYERAARKKYRAGNPRYWADGSRKSVPFKTHLCANARFRGRKRGIEATITPADVVWPSHCPVLGIALDYPERSGQRKDQKTQPNWPSLDRWDNTKGYVPGNVFVVSYRANTLKGAARPDEILKIAKYIMAKPRYRQEQGEGALLGAGASE